MSIAGRSSVIPCLRYRDAPAAIAWLGRVFGFVPQLVVPGEEGVIHHAQLVLDGGMVMLGSAVESDYGKLCCQPDESGGRVTQSTCLVVDDADAVHARALAEGARIVRPISDQPYGGRAFICHDPEGHVWCVGTYDPWT